MSLSKLVLVTGDTVTLQYQLVSGENGFPIDITGNTFKFAAKLNPTETAFIIDPIDGVIDDAVNGKFSFEVAVPVDPNDGVYEIEMTIPGPKVTTLTPGGGLPISISQEIIT